MDGGGSVLHNPVMALFRVAVVAAISLLASGCAYRDTGPSVAFAPASTLRANGMPKLLPCQIGDRLCTPEQ